MLRMAYAGHQAINKGMGISIKLRKSRGRPRKGGALMPAGAGYCQFFYEMISI